MQSDHTNHRALCVAADARHSDSLGKSSRSDRDLRQAVHGRLLPVAALYQLSNC